MAKRPALTSLSTDSTPHRVDAAPRTLIEQAYARLRSDIVEGRIAPGEKLRIEHLRQRYGVSAGTLREALTRLVSDALVEAEGQRGFRVMPVTFEDMDDLTNLRVQLEIEALRQSIRHSDANWREQVGDIYEQMSAIEQPILPEMTPRWEALNGQFHEALLANCGSDWTLHLLRLLNRHSERYRRYAIGLNQGQRDVHQEHRSIYEAAMSGNELRAALELEAHIRATPDLLKAAASEGIDVFGSAPAGLTPPRADSGTHDGTAEPPDDRRSPAPAGA